MTDIRLDSPQAVANNMLLLGILLIILSLATGVFTTVGDAPDFPLMPGILGFLIVMTGILVRNFSGWHRRLLYVTMGLAFLAIVFTIDGVAITAAILKGSHVEHPEKAVEQALTAVLCVWFVAVSVRGIVASPRVRA